MGEEGGRSGEGEGLSGREGGRKGEGGRRKEEGRGGGRRAKRGKKWRIAGHSTINYTLFYTFFSA